MPSVQTNDVVNENEDLQEDKSQKDNSSLNGKPRGKQSTADRYGTGGIIQLPINKIHKKKKLSVIYDFYRLKRKYSPENRLDGKLFKDRAFPAKESSIERVKIQNFADKVKGDIKWLRPMEINPLAKFFVDGYSRFDVEQGFLGDCWFLAAAASLAMHPKLFSQVVPEDNGCFGEDYAGIFHFRFWQSGRWVDVVIDDRLPTYEGKLIFAKSTSTNEFWIALLEKAYAKVNGSWGALEGGLPGTAFIDLTGGMTISYLLQAGLYDEEVYGESDRFYSLSKFFNILLKAQEQNLLMGIYSPKKNDQWKGLYGGHAYSITGVYNDEENSLVRLRNPWGSGEWTGTFSDNVLEFILTNFLGDGEKKVFLHHPQYRMILKPLVEQGDGKHRLIVRLTLNAEKRTDSTDPAAGFKIYQLPASPDIEESEGLGIDFFGTRNPIFQTNVQPFEGNCGGQCLLELQAGSYCIVPYTKRPAEGTKFSIELWSQVTPNKDASPAAKE